jgi:predicted Zn-dependent protease
VHVPRFDTDKESFYERIVKEVEASLGRVYETQGSSCTMIFTEPKPAHEVIREKIIGRVVDACM